MGSRRTRNEDQFLVAELHRQLRICDSSLTAGRSVLEGDSPAHLLAVADGVGGRPGGQLASALAIDTLVRYVLAVLPCAEPPELRPPLQIGTLLQRAVRRCDERVAAAAESDPSRAGMATTVTAALVFWPRAYVVHAGDSRCYLIRAAAAHRLTRDQSLAQQLVDEGALEPEQAEGSRFSDVLWSTVGGSDREQRPVTPEASRCELQAGDVLLCCSDGLTKHVDEQQLVALIGSASSAEQAQRTLIEAALEGGGSDNVTVALAGFGRWGQVGAQPAARPQQLAAHHEPPTPPPAPLAASE